MEGTNEPMIYVKQKTDDSVIVHSRYDGKDEAVSLSLWKGHIEVGASVSCKHNGKTWEFSCK